MTSSTVVFVGRVLIDSGEGIGNRAARVLVEEPLQNISRDLREVDVDSDFGSSCYFRLEAGERYVFLAVRSADRRPALQISVCSKSFPLTGNEHLLDALRNQLEGGAPRMVGSVRRETEGLSEPGGIAGAHVTAISDTMHFEAVSNANGKYEIRGMIPGPYRIDVSKEGYVPDQDFNHRSFDPPGSSLINVKSCELRDLLMWAHGTISGTVSNKAGEPLAGVEVQAFGLYTGEFAHSRLIRTGKTDSQGRYLIEPLPPANYFVAVNAEEDHDAGPYPPALYDHGKSLALGETGSLTGVNLVLAEKRVASTVRVNVRRQNDTPVTKIFVHLQNSAGVDRWRSELLSAAGDGNFEIPVYLNEHYVVKVSDYSIEREKLDGYDYLGGSAEFDATPDHAPVLVVVAPKRW